MLDKLWREIAFKIEIVFSKDITNEKMRTRQQSIDVFKDMDAFKERVKRLNKASHDIEEKSMQYLQQYIENSEYIDDSEYACFRYQIASDVEYFRELMKK